MAKKGHQKFWRMKTELFWGKGQNIFHAAEKSSEIEGI